MVLLHAAAAVLPLDSLIIATFDHGTGPAATSAVAAVERETSRLSLDCVTGRADAAGKSEAEWRRDRWAFLEGVSKRYRAPVVTAHTRDDQIETVFIRVLRDAGPRGLSALYAPSPVIRPLLETSRAVVHAYAAKCNVIFVTDPSNFDRRHLRNRVRHDLLPAIIANTPDFGDQLLALARRSADWRARIDQIAATFTVMPDTTGSYTIPRQQLTGYTSDALRTLWPALAARAGVVMDWRGTHRLAEFTIDGESGQSIQLSGGVDVRMRRDALVLHREGGRA
jgi:tRNA(Ile)-lysidine synthase